MHKWYAQMFVCIFIKLYIYFTSYLLRNYFYCNGGFAALYPHALNLLCGLMWECITTYVVIKFVLIPIVGYLHIPNSLNSVGMG